MPYLRWLLFARLFINFIENKSFEARLIIHDLVPFGLNKLREATTSTLIIMIINFHDELCLGLSLCKGFDSLGCFCALVFGVNFFNLQI